MLEDELLPFSDALELARRQGGEKIHALLGNGFSRSFRDDIFSYDALLKKAKFKKHGTFLRRIFSRLGTSDFERVIRLFVEMKVVLRGLPRVPAKLVPLLDRLEQTLKDTLANTLAENHPEGPFEISNEEYRCAQKFLAHFERIYTLNYDLLLYWTLLNQDQGGVDDGFRNPDDPSCDYVTWEPENRLHQCLYYLHGALHIFDSGDEIRKFTWCRTGIRLKEQIRGELTENRYPLIVAEGKASSKREKIFHNIYLASAYKSLLAIGGSLFIYGASLHEQDDHILRALGENTKLKCIFVGIYGNPDSPSASKTIARVQRLGSGKTGKRLYFFNSKAVKVWR